MPSMIAKERQKELKKFQKSFGFSFKELSLLDCALTHKSYVDQNGVRGKDNERLEFVGDAVIDLIIRDYSLKRFPERNEGELSKLRSAVASEATLSKIARRMDLGKYLLMGQGEESSGGRKKRSLLANTFEAVAAAIYLDGGFDKAHKIILSFLKEDIEKVSIGGNQRDYKSRLQEYTQNRLGCIPRYRVVGEAGPDHNKVFLIQLTLEGRIMGNGRGKSKKVAEQRAAREALTQLLENNGEDEKSH
jgi:ribonuclease III